LIPKNKKKGFKWGVHKDREEKGKKMSGGKFQKGGGKTEKAFHGGGGVNVSLRT